MAERPASDSLHVTWICGEDLTEALHDLLYEHIEPVLRFDACLDVDDLIDNVAAEEAIAFVVTGEEFFPIHCVCVVEIADYSRKRALNVVTAVGADINLWGELLTETLERYRREIGADIVRAYCRPGMGVTLARMPLQGMRWKRKLDVMELDCG
jgi:hypothetical protein